MGGGTWTRDLEPGTPGGLGGGLTWGHVGANMEPTWGQHDESGPGVMLESTWGQHGVMLGLQKTSLSRAWAAKTPPKMEANLGLKKTIF